MKNNKKITVVGAGPGGLTAAINLVKNGYEVDLFEQNNDVGFRFNGDFQGLENWSDHEDTLDILKNLGIETNFLCQPYYGSDGLFYGPKLKKVVVKTSRPLFYLIERGAGNNSFDQGLRQQAEKVGVNIIWNHKLESIKEGYAIVSTGPKAADAIAKGFVFKTSLKDSFIAFLDNKIAPKAYAYLLVNNGRATFATCLFEDFKNERMIFDKALETLKSVIDIDINEPKKFGGFVNFFNKPILSKNRRFLYVGENAGFQDALWGFGIKYAMLSGYYAAQSIINDTSYKDLCMTHLVPKFQTSLANRWLFAHLTNYGYSFLLSKLESFDDVIPPLRKHYNQSISKKMIFRIANRWYKTKLINKQCLNEHCDCVWCRHGTHAHAN